MPQNKYKNLLDEVQSKTNEYINFNEKIAKIMIELENYDFSSKINKTEWVKLLNKIRKEDSYQIMIAAMQSHNVPAEIFNFSYSLLPYRLQHNALFCSNITPEAFDDFYQKTMSDNIMADIIETKGHLFSHKVIRELCNKPINDLREMLYTPFMHLKEIDYDIVEKYLNSVEKDEIEPSELALSFIATNENLNDKIRNRAFNIGYIPDVIEDYGGYTIEMCSELYRTYTDLMFDIKENIRSADRNIGRIFKEKWCPESCMIDFIKRCADNPFIESETYEYIITSTESRRVLQEALEHYYIPHTIDCIIQNGKCISSCALENLLKVLSPKQLNSAFIKSVMYNTITDAVAKQFACNGDAFIDTIALLSKKTETITSNDIAKAWEKSPNEKWFKYLLDVKCIADLYLHNKAYNAFVMFVLDKMMSDKNCPIANTTNQLINKENILTIISEFKNNWILIYDEELKNIKAHFTYLIDKYPEFENISKTVIEKATQNNKNFKLANKYTEIFYIKAYSDVLSVNINEIYKLNSQRLNTFINNIKNTNDFVIAKTIKENIINEICNNMPELPNYSHRLIYKLNNLYNVCDEIINNKDKDEINLSDNDLSHSPDLKER